MFSTQYRCFHQKPDFFYETILSLVEYLTDLWIDQWEYGLMTPVSGLKTHIHQCPPQVPHASVPFKLRFYSLKNKLRPDFVTKHATWGNSIAQRMCSNNFHCTYHSWLRRQIGRGTLERDSSYLPYSRLRRQQELHRSFPKIMSWSSI